VRIPLRLLVGSRSGMSLTFLTVALLTPSTARAGCDYPTHVERTPHDPSMLLSNTQTVSKPISAPPSKPCPCSGPTCSRRPFVPSAPPSFESVKFQEWGRLIPRLILIAPQRAVCLPDVPSHSPVRRAAIIYRPPRLLS